MKLLIILAISLFNFNLANCEETYLSTQENFRGNYLYPVDEDSQSMATWILQGLKWTVVNKNVRVSYYLPVELVGEPVEIEMTGKISKNKSFFKITGKYGIGICLPRQNNEFSCLLKFKKMKIKKKIIMNYLENKIKDTGVKKFKYKLAALFSADPIGVLNITHD
ncbi:MAG: hypothetical protein HN576_01270 [Bacteriovoracaceae bacterium]|jgi:hypothetical protein|nr:hypothetical protein [Bacteriovoracaceae bacterium]